MTKLKFAVEDYEIEENPSSQFALLNMKIVSSGMNAHKLPITVEAVKKSASTLFGKPVLANYLEGEEKLGGHDKTEIPIGTFLDSNVEITEEGGKTWLSSKAWIWKRYFPHIMDVFKRDGGKTNISMEIEVTDSGFELDGFEWIKSFDFLGVTAIGIEPAIFGSGATVLQFSRLKDLAQQEFSNKYEDIDFTVPEKIKEWCNKGLSYSKKGGGHSVSLAVARHLINNSVASPQKILQMKKFFDRNKDFQFEESETPDIKQISYMLYGGNLGSKWSNDVWMSMKEIDDKKCSFFSDELFNLNKEDEEGMKKTMNSAAPPPEEDEEKKEEMSAKSGDEEETKKEEIKEIPDGEKKEEEKMSVEKEPEDVEDSPEEEAKETPEEEKKEEMSLNAYADVAAFLSYLEGETEEHACMSQMFSSKEVSAEKMYSAFASLAKKFCDQKMQMESLKKFKAEVEEKEFAEKVKASINQVYSYLSKEELEAKLEESKAFTLATFSDWDKTLKAFAFDSSKNKKIEKKEEEHIHVPFENLMKKSTTEKPLWK